MDESLAIAPKKRSRKFILWFLIVVAFVAWTAWLIWSATGVGSYDLPRAARSLPKAKEEARLAGLYVEESDLPAQNGTSLEDVSKILDPISEYRGGSIVFFAEETWKDRARWERFAEAEEGISKIESVKAMNWRPERGYWRGPDQQMMPRLQKAAKLFSIFAIEHSGAGRDAESLRAFQNALLCVRLLSSQKTLKSVYFATITEESVLTTVPVLLEEGVGAAALLKVLMDHQVDPSPAEMIREEAWYELNSMPRMLRRGRLSYMGTSVDPTTLEMSGSMVPVDGDRALDALQARSFEFWTQLKQMADQGKSLADIRSEAEVLRQAAEDSGALSRVRVAAMELQFYDLRRFEVTTHRQTVARGLVQSIAKPGEPLPMDPASTDPLRVERSGGMLKVWSRGPNGVDDLARGDDVVMSVRMSAR